MRRLTNRTPVHIIAAALALCFLLLTVHSVKANGAPIKIILTYLAGVSSWGPTNATGVAEVVMKEGEINLSAVGLPPQSEEVYVAWLINTRNNESLAIGQFNSDQSEAVKIQAVLPTEIPDKGWNLFLLTVEDGGQMPGSPGSQKSIAGYFPDANESGRVPAQLPKTGGEVDQGASRVNQAPPSNRQAPKGNVDVGNNPLTYGVVVLAVLGLGILTRARMRR